MTQTDTAPGAATPWYTVREAARYLSVTDQTVRKLILRGELQGYRLGAVECRIHKWTLDEYLKGRPITAPAAVRDCRRGGYAPTGRPPGRSRKAARAAK